MKLGMKKINLVEEIKNLIHVKNSSQNFQMYATPDRNEAIFVRYTDKESNISTSALYEVGGYKNDAIKTSATFLPCPNNSIEYQFNELVALPYEPIEWLNDYDLYYCLKNNSRSNEFHKRYYLSHRSKNQKLRFAFSLSSPLTAVCKLHSGGMDLYDDAINAIDSDCIIEADEALDILTNTAKIHDQTINQIRAGDVVFTNNSALSAVSKRLVDGTKVKPMSHVAIMGSHGIIQEATASGHGQVRRLGALAVLDTSKSGWIVVRALPTIAFYSHADFSVGLMDTGKPYSKVAGIIKGAVNSILNINLFKGTENPDSMICTQFANFTLRQLATNVRYDVNLKKEPQTEKNTEYLNKIHDLESANAMLNRLLSNGAEVVTSSDEVEREIALSQHSQTTKLTTTV